MLLSRPLAGGCEAGDTGRFARVAKGMAVKFRRGRAAVMDGPRAMVLDAGCRNSKSLSGIPTDGKTLATQVLSQKTGLQG